MEILALIVGLALTGAVVGALGRLALPGPDPMTMWQTIGVGIAGSFLAGLVIGVISDGEAGATLLSSVLGATFIVWLVRRSRARRAPSQWGGRGGA
jgi:uncharacterized membrane protein YeaQ/YmgE (transglycosylase-associated protein family)